MPPARQQPLALTRRSPHPSNPRIRLRARHRRTRGRGGGSTSHQSFTIWLPERYVGGAGSDDSTLASIRALGGNCDDVANLIEPQRQAFLFVSVDRETCAVSVASVQILESPSGPDVVSPEQFVGSFRPGLPSTAEFLDWVEGSIGGRPAAFMRVRRNYPSVSTIQKLYAVRGEGVWFIVVVAALPGDFDAAVAGYDEIAATFRLN